MVGEVFLEGSNRRVSGMKASFVLIMSHFRHNHIDENQISRQQNSGLQGLKFISFLCLFFGMSQN